MKVLVVGLTGGIVTGKSTVAKIFQQLGAIIIDADLIARQMVLPGRKSWKMIIKNFGKEILNENNEIDRKKMADIVFSDNRKLKLLNSITHPEIINNIKKKIKEIKNNSENERICIIDIPLLFETKTDNIMDKIIVVYLDREQQLTRLKTRNGLNNDEAIKRIESQMPMQDKIKLADYVIDNSKSIENTKEQVIKLWKELNTFI
ncbi:MAG: dephospho-CoA kinase [Atribacterota bacterium]|nr:dephospho-CoA kinase [Atribacterota bacterium]